MIRRDDDVRRLAEAELIERPSDRREVAVGVADRGELMPGSSVKRLSP